MAELMLRVMGLSGTLKNSFDSNIDTACLIYIEFGCVADVNPQNRL